MVLLRVEVPNETAIIGAGITFRMASLELRVTAPLVQTCGS